MGGIDNKGSTGFWRRNWLSLAVISFMSWIGIGFWQDIVEISPFLIIVHTFFLYLFVVKFFYDNCLSCEKLLTELREGGWIVIKNVARPGIVIWQKCGAGVDLLTQRLGVEQELIIAEKRRKKLEIELSQKELHTQLAQMQVLSSKPPAGQISEKKVVEEKINLPSEANIEEVPPYAKYAPVLMEYLKQVRWERLTVTQAQQILHKRFGTVKLVLEELVHQQKMEYVRIGKRIAYRPVINDESK